MTIGSEKCETLRRLAIVLSPFSFPTTLRGRLLPPPFQAKPGGIGIGEGVGRVHRQFFRFGGAFRYFAANAGGMFGGMNPLCLLLTRAPMGIEAHPCTFFHPNQAVGLLV